MHSRTSFTPVILASLIFVAEAAGQAPATSFAQPHARILQSVDEFNTVTLGGNVHPLAAATLSQPADAFTPMEHMVLFLKGDATQEAQLEQLIAQQGDPKSPLYRHFLTPEEFGAQFGVAKADLDKIASWLRSHGFSIEEIPSGNRALVFSGTSGQVANTFRTEIRRYTASGATHFANASDPQIPAALASAVGGVVKLHDFRHAANISKSAAVSAAQFANPQFTYGSGHYLAPADYATIYNISPLYSASINGTGQTIAVLARSNIYLSDVQSFRSKFGLTSNNPQIVITSTDPGVLQGDSVETTLDTEWSGAVAPNATIKVIVAASTNTADGIDLSALYAVNHNVAPILTLSYGSCEAAMGSSELSFYNSLWQQAAAQGMSVMVSSGDSGAAGCYGGSSSSGSGKGINGLCSSPYATCVGGTQFAEGSNPGQYWLPGNNAVYGSATGYIPETVWNESGSNGGSGLWAGGGGASIAFSKPSWQAGPGVPADGHRDVPDVSLTASGHDGYLIVYGGGLYAEGGTSASAPSFAGLMALVDQKTNARQGLANAVLYPLAASQATGGAAIFHDTKTGNNSVPGVTGFSATTGYDLASGLGSVDAAQMVNHWTDGSKGVAPTISLSASATSLTVISGQTGQTTITSTASSTLKSAVTLAVAGAPAGVTAKLASATIASPGSGSVVLSVAASSTITPGTYSLTVTAQGGGQTATLSITLVIPARTFTLSPSTVSVSAVAGDTARVSLATTPENGFNSVIALSVSGLPAGITASFAPATLSVTAAGASVLTLTIAKTAPGGRYSLTISATGGGVTKTSAVSLVVTVPASCTLAANPSSVSLTAGQSASVQVSCGSVQGTFSGPLTLSVAGAAGGMTAQAASTFAAGSSTPLNIGTSATTAAGKYSLTLAVSGSGLTQSLALPVTIAAPSTFNLTAAQSLLTVKAGASGQAGFNSMHQGGFNSSIAFTLTGLPSGVTASLSRTTLAAPGDGTLTATFAAAANAQPGTYTVTLTGVGGGQTKTASMGLTISANKDFSFALNLSSMTIQQGGPAGVVIVSTGNFTGGFNSTITLSFTGLAPGMNYGFVAGNAANNLVNISEGITASASTPAGTYPVTITASGAGISHSGVVQVTVTTAGTQTHK
jgi:uncharacterized membrane protein